MKTVIQMPYKMVTKLYKWDACRCIDDTPIVKYQFSKERAKELGINYTPLEEGVKETVESLKEKKFLQVS